MRVLHVIPALTLGGAGRSLIATARAGAATHAVASLTRPAPAALAAARAAGIEPVSDPASAAGAADVVHLHFWNAPALYELLEAGLPPVRLVVGVHVGGAHAPQVLPGEVADLADEVVAATPLTCEVLGRELEVIPDVGGFERLPPHPARPSRRFAVAHVGTVDRVKIHPRFTDLHARARVAGMRVVVCGDGDARAALERRARELGAAERFEFRGRVDDVGAALAGAHAFGYPLCEDNYSASELALQEAMYAGVPPVVLPFGGAARVVEHGRTGLVAADEDAYVAALERLAGDEPLRLRLGVAAAAHARRTFDPRLAGARWEAVYGRAMAVARRARRLEPSATPAHRFVRSLGDRPGPFADALRAGDERRRASAEDAIAACSPVMAGAASGGVVHYRLAHPDDARLRLWSGLALSGQDRTALAAADLSAALAMGARSAGAERRLAAVGAR